MHESKKLEYAQKIRQHGLRVTKAKLYILDFILQDGKHKHITAEVFHAELSTVGYKVSLATVYNTLNVFSKVGLLRKIKTPDYIIYDTNVSQHGHIIDYRTQQVTDLSRDDFLSIVDLVIDKYSLKEFNKDKLELVLTIYK